MSERTLERYTQKVRVMLDGRPFTTAVPLDRRVGNVYPSAATICAVPWVLALALKFGERHPGTGIIILSMFGTASDLYVLFEAECRAAGVELVSLHQFEQLFDVRSTYGRYLCSVKFHGTCTQKVCSDCELFRTLRKQLFAVNMVWIRLSGSPFCANASNTCWW